MARARLLLVGAPLLLLALLAVGCGSGRSQAPRDVPPPRTDRAEEPPDRKPVPERKPRRPPKASELEARSFPASLPIPVDGVERSDLERSFNAPRSGGRRHRAIDIFAPRRTPVRAPIEGYVTRRKVLSLGGKTISIVGPGGYRQYFAHLDAWARPDVGDYVGAGEVIGYVGNSGNASRGPTHLHYALYLPWGDPVDPFDLFERGGGAFEAR